MIALPGGDLRAAIGSGYRENRFRTAGGTAGNRHSVYAYGELNLPLIAPANAVPAITRLTLTAAIRHERYRDLGAVKTPKLGLLYAPTSDFDLKEAWGKSFKAPTFVQQFSNAGAYLYPRLDVADLIDRSAPIVAASDRVRIHHAARARHNTTSRVVVGSSSQNAPLGA